MSVFDRISGLIRQASGQPVIRDGAVTLAIKVASAALSYLMFVLVANALSTEQYGYFGFGFAFGIGLANIATFGTTTSLLRFIPQYTSSGRDDLAKGYALLSGRIVVAIALALSVAAFLLLPLVWPETDSAGLQNIVVAIFFMLVATFSDYISGLVRGLGMVTLSQLPKDVGWRVLVCAFAVFIVLAGWSQTSASVLMMTALLLLATTMYQYFWSRRKISELMQAKAAYESKSWIASTIPIWAANGLSAMIQQFDVVVLGVLGLSAESGPYFAAMRTASLLALMVVAGNLASAPLMASLYHNGQKQELARMVRLISMAIGIPTLLGLGFMAVAGKWLLGFFDHSFVSAYPFLMVLAVGYACDAVAGPNAFLLQMTKHERAYLTILGVSYACVLGAQLILIPSYGLMGAAIPSALGMIGNAVAGSLLTRRYLGISPGLIGLLFKR